MYSSNAFGVLKPANHRLFCNISERIAPAFMIFLLGFPMMVLAQNVGIGTSAPNAQLHVYGAGTVPLRVESASSSTSEIIFFTNGTSRGLVGAYQGNMELMTNGNTSLHLGTNLVNHVTITGTGNVGIATSSPDEKLVIGSGNLKLSNSQLGVILNAADRPMITRGFDQFTSGNYDGLGRWGLFMEPSRLTLGIPNLPGKAVEFARYEANSTRTTLMTVNNDGELNRPATAGADLVPVCMGSVRWNNGSLANTPIINGSGNFTLTPYAEAGMVEITITGHSYSTANYVTQVTCIRDTNYGSATGYAAVQDGSNGKLRVYTYINGGTQYSRSFHFVVYKIN
jgi:hypothetical protein